MSGTILLADDSLTIQKVVELTFADTNFRVVAVSSGDELLERLRDSQPDLIICDVIMPGKDGYEVCQQIKSSSEWLHLPVILLTGTFEPFDRDRAIAAGCSEIITKPFEARKLVDTVERLIGGPDVQTPQAAAAVDAWPDDATPVEIPPDPASDEFGTHISVPEPEDDGIEFTTSGFAEMEAAGQTPSDASPETEPKNGLDYEFGAPETDAGDADAILDPSAQTVKIDLASMADESGTDDEQSAVEVQPVAPPEPEAEAIAPEPEPAPFVTPDEEPFAAPVDDAAEEDHDSEFQDEPSMADTSPVEPPEEEPEPTLAAPLGEGPVQLTDDDIDRIARRVVELASDRLDQIAWEVVPDMAEIVVRQRIRELEAESEKTAPEPVQ